MKCDNCGKTIEGWGGGPEHKGPPNFQLKFFKGRIYQIQRRFDSVDCLESWIALSLPRLVERVVGSTAT